MDLNNLFIFDCQFFTNLDLINLNEFNFEMFGKFCSRIRIQILGIYFVESAPRWTIRFVVLQQMTAATDLFRLSGSLIPCFWFLFWFSDLGILAWTFGFCFCSWSFGSGVLLCFGFTSSSELHFHYAPTSRMYRHGFYFLVLGVDTWHTSPRFSVLFRRHSDKMVDIRLPHDKFWWWRQINAVKTTGIDSGTLPCSHTYR